MSTTEFDAYKHRYRDVVQKAISFVGTDVDYFTAAKASALLEVCRRQLGNPQNLDALDLGCGIGLTDEHLVSDFRSLTGIDVSAECVEVAARRNIRVCYSTYDGKALPFPDGRFDVVFTICVMHHVPPTSWARFVSEMRRVVRPGGIVVVFEHNPFNPLTRIAVNRCPFDADAVLLSMRQTAGLLDRAGLEVVERRYILFFPFRSRLFQAVERSVYWLPLGGQYYLVGRVGRYRPAATGRSA